ncbi:MAG TPA: hypothetical protein VN408_00540, partial [Actinoplanes sp.]|nr:hypothetical protein [Actinoplanes sp.]
MGEIRPGRHWWRVGFRALVIGLWVLAASVTWWTSPRQSTYEQARADITAQRVVAFQWGDHWAVEETRRWFN